MKKKLTNVAFTLAETLIVIGIIGVVAALTLPNLNHATGDKEKVTRVKKIYSSLTDAVDRAQVIYGPFDTWFKDLSTKAEVNERFAKRVTEFMKVSKDCGFDDGCFSSAPYIGYDNETNNSLLNSLQNSWHSSYMVQLADGASIAFYLCGDKVSSSYVMTILVDIDGMNKGKNKHGDDLFYFQIAGGSAYESASFITNQLVTDYRRYADQSPQAYSLATWVIENGNLDYLKAEEGENGWPCNNSDIILDGVTNTSCH